jgi:hypothetical protein
MTVALDTRRSALSPAIENRPGVLIGEIHTGVLQNSGPITTETSVELLGLTSHQRVRSWERPVRQAASPPVLTGVDCPLPAASGSVRRAVGTVSAEARVTAGRLLQASARARVVPSAERRRLAWSHYLTRPGTVEVLGDLKPGDVADGFVRRPPQAGTLDLGGVCAGLMGRIQASPALDRGAPFRASRTRLRWTATAGSGSSVRFAIEPEGLRTLDVVAPGELLGELELLAQDVALHDWLLTAVSALIEQAGIGGRERSAVVAHLRPAVDNLLHAWMPGARLPGGLVPFRDEIERVSGLSRQWETAVDRIRDQLALAVVEQGRQ